MGRIVEDSSTPVCFIYHQGWQGLIYGDIALKVRKHRIQGEKNGLALLTPAENYIPQFNPARAGRAPRAIANNTAVAGRHVNHRGSCAGALD